MKIGRLLVLLALVMGLMAGPWQAPAEAIMLGRVGQIKTLAYNPAAQTWSELKPDGTSSLFTLAPGQSFIMTEIRGRFYVTTPASDTGPYRIYLVGPNSSTPYIANMTDITYPGSSTIWGGLITELNLNPGYIFSVLPTARVQQMPPPPTNPNDGPVRSGSLYMTIRGYVVP
jgi:hypothetical protein